MYNLLFASGHGGSTREILQLCQQANVRLSLPGRITQSSLRHLSSEEEAFKLNIQCYSTLPDIQKAIRAGEINGWLIARPEALEGIREHFQDTDLLPIAARHSVNSFEKYKKLGLKNFISPSRHALQKMGAPNSFLSTKTRDFSQEITPLSASKRKGFYSYIHHYAKYWARAHSFFQEVVKLIDNAVPIENFGKESDKGIVDDEKMMVGSKATLHIKDGQVCCNAPINSICLGIPVLMDYETLEKIGMQDYIVHNVSGLLFETPQECARHIRTLQMEPAYLDELSQRTLAFAKLKCQYSQYDIEQFKLFLYRMQK